MGVKDLLQVLTSMYEVQRPHVIFRVNIAADAGIPNALQDGEGAQESNSISLQTEESSFHSTSVLSDAAASAESGNSSALCASSSVDSEVDELSSDPEAYSSDPEASFCDGEFDLDLRESIVGVDVAAFAFPLTKRKSCYMLQFSEGANTYLAEEFDERILQPLFCDCGVAQVYLVFDGKTYPPKSETSQARRKPRRLARLQLEAMRVQFKSLTSTKYGVGARGQQEALEKLRAAYMKEMKVAAAPNENMLNSIKDFAKNKYGNKVHIRVAAYEADPQLVALQNMGVCIHILSSDSDIIALGAKQVIYRFCGKSLRCLYLTRKYSLNCLRQALKLDDSIILTVSDLYQFSVILGTDYIGRVKGFGKNAAISFMRNVVLNGMQQALQQWKKEFILNGETLTPTELMDLWRKAFTDGMCHPVFKYPQDSLTFDSCIVESLNIPYFSISDTQFKHILDIPNATNIFHDATRQKRFSENDFLFWGSNIDFLLSPICMIPSEMLIQWCITRGIIVPGTIQRHLLEGIVDVSLKQNRQKVAPEILKNRLSSYDPPQFFKLTTKYENKSIKALIEMVKRINVPDITLFCQYDSILRRGLVLLKGGHVNFQKVQSGSGVSVSDQSEVTLFRTTVVASFRTASYATQIGVKNDTLSEELCGCSCVAGSLYCSHQIALTLYLLVVLRLDFTPQDVERIMPTHVREIDALAIPTDYAMKILTHNAKEKASKKKKLVASKQVTFLTKKLQIADKSRKKDDISLESDIFGEDEEKNIGKFDIVAELKDWCTGTLSASSEGKPEIEVFRSAPVQKALADALRHPLDDPENVKKQEKILSNLYLGIEQYNATVPENKAYYPTVYSLAKATYEKSKDTGFVERPWNIGEF